MENAKERIKDIILLMEPITEDNGVPRNIRNVIKENLTKFQQAAEKGEEEIEMKTASAIYSLEEISNDINMPHHIRTELWNILSELERLKEELK